MKMIDHRSCAHNLSRREIKLKNCGLNAIWTHDLCDICAVVYQLSFKANWELAMLWVPNILVEGEECKWIYEDSYLNCGEW